MTDDTLVLIRDEHVDPSEGPVDVYVDGLKIMAHLRAGHIVHCRLGGIRLANGEYATSVDQLTFEFRPIADGSSPSKWGEH